MTVTVPTTTPVVHTTPEVLSSEFQSAREELHRAKTARQAKDTPANREAVQNAHARLDAILDFYLDTREA